MVLTVFAGIGEFERALIVERTSTGRQAAKKRGVRFGRPSKLSAEKAALAARLIAEGRSAKEVADTFGVNRSTIYRTAAIGQALQTRPQIIARVWIEPFRGDMQKTPSSALFCGGVHDLSV